MRRGRESDPTVVPVKRGSETICWWKTNAVFANWRAEYLEMSGYTVIAAAEGHEAALALARETCAAPSI